MSETRLVVAFPAMHEAARMLSVPGVKCLDPGGLPDMGDCPRFVPENLPMESAVAAGWLAQAIGYAGMFQRKGEMAAVAATADDKYAGSMQAIMTELLSMGKAPEEPGVSEEDLAAQRLLLLAFDREKAMLEMDALDTDVSSNMERLGESLGLDAEDSAEVAALAAAEVSPDLDIRLYDSPTEWQAVLKAFCRFLPEDVVLFVDYPEILAYWIDLGIEFKTADSAFLDECLPERPQGEWSVAEASVGAFTGKPAGNERRITVVAAIPATQAAD